MAFTNVIRRAVSSTIGATGSQRHYHHKSFSKLFSNSAPLTRTATLSQNLFRSSFSTDTTQTYFERVSNLFRTPRQRCDSNLVKVIDSQIQDKGEDDIPMNILRIKYGERTLKFTMKDVEVILVTVHMPSELPLSDQSPIRMEVEVIKGIVALFCIRALFFDVSAYPDRIEINSLRTMRDQFADRRPKNFRELDENLQKALHKYLNVRGIDLGLVNFLHKHMNKSGNKEYIRWLQGIRKCV